MRTPSIMSGNFLHDCHKERLSLSSLFLSVILFSFPRGQKNWLKFRMTVQGEWEGRSSEWLQSKNSEKKKEREKRGPRVRAVRKCLLSGNRVRDSGGGALKMKGRRVKETKRKREDSGWRVKDKVGVGVTVSKPQEQQRKAVNGSSPCLNRLWTVLRSTANHKSSQRLLWVRALTRCLPPDQGDDTGRGEWKRQRGGGGNKEMRREGGVIRGRERVGLRDYGFAF